VVFFGIFLFFYDFLVLQTNEDVCCKFTSKIVVSLEFNYVDFETIGHLQNCQYWSWCEEQKKNCDFRCRSTCL